MHQQLAKNVGSVYSHAGTATIRDWRQILTQKLFCPCKEGLLQEKETVTCDNASNFQTIGSKHGKDFWAWK